MYTVKHHQTLTEVSDMSRTVSEWLGYRFGFNRKLENMMKKAFIIFLFLSSLASEVEKPVILTTEI